MDRLRFNQKVISHFLRHVEPYFVSGRGYRYFWIFDYLLLFLWHLKPLSVKQKTEYVYFVKRANASKYLRRNYSSYINVCARAVTFRCKCSKTMNRLSCRTRSIMTGTPLVYQHGLKWGFSVIEACFLQVFGSSVHGLGQMASFFFKSRIIEH